MGQWILLISALLFFNTNAASSHCLDHFAQVYHRLNVATFEPVIANQEDAPAIRKFIDRIRHDAGLDDDLLQDLENLNDTYMSRAGNFFLLKNGYGEIVGTGAYYAKDLKLQPFVATLARIYLDPSLRGKGMGEKMVHHLLKEAHSRGYRRFDLKTDKKWTQAIRLYEKVGFNQVSFDPKNPSKLFFELNGYTPIE